MGKTRCSDSSDDMKQKILSYLDDSGLVSMRVTELMIGTRLNRSDLTRMLRSLEHHGLLRIKEGIGEEIVVMEPQSGSLRDLM